MDTFLNEDNIMGQKRSSKNKKFLIYRKDKPEYVFKGLYSITSSAYKNIIYRTKKLREWDAKSVTFAISQVNYEKDSVAIVYQNLLGHFPVSSESHTEKWESGYTYNISTDNGIMKFSKILPERTDLLTLDLLKSYIYLFILKAGDMGLHNTITDGKDVWIVDYDDNLMRDRDDPTFYFNRPSADKYKVYETFRKWYIPVAECLKDLVIDEIYVERRNSAYTLLLKYGGDKLLVPIVSKGELFYKGPNVAKTMHGLTSSIAKSALQKNVRRGRLEQSLFSAFELYMFKEVDGIPLVSNMYHRLVIISCEDISPYSLRIPAVIASWVVDWVKGGKDKLGIFGNEDKYDPFRLASMVHILSNVPKSRIASHLWNGYGVDMARPFMEREGFEVEKIESNYLTEEDKMLYANPPSYVKKSDYNIDNGKMVLILMAIRNRLKNKDKKVVTWLYYFMDKYGGEKLEGRRRKMAPLIIWEMFKEFVNPEFLDPLERGYFYLTEKRPIFMCVVTNILYGIQDDSLNASEFNAYKNYWDGKKDYVQGLIEGRYKLKIESYMLDKHTSSASGTKEEKHKQFVLEGAQVENQDMKVYDEKLKKVYESLPPR